MEYVCSFLYHRGFGWQGGGGLVIERHYNGHKKSSQVTFASCNFLRTLHRFSLTQLGFCSSFPYFILRFPGRTYNLPYSETVVKRFLGQLTTFWAIRSRHRKRAALKFCSFPAQQHCGTSTGNSKPKKAYIRAKLNVGFKIWG